MQPTHITSLAELQHEQHRLKRQMEFTRKELIKSVNHTTQQGKDVLLKKFMLPAGAAGLGLYAAKKLISSSGGNKEEKQIWEDQQQSSGSWFAKLMLIAIPFVQQYFMKEKLHEQVEEETTPATVHAKAGSSNQPDWLTTIIPVLAPVMQHYFVEKAAAADKSKVVVEKQETDSGDTYNQVKIKRDSSSTLFDWLYKLMPVVLPLVQQHFFNKEVKEQVNDVQHASAPNTINHPAKQY